LCDAEAPPFSPVRGTGTSAARSTENAGASQRGEYEREYRRSGCRLWQRPLRGRRRNGGDDGVEHAGDEAAQSWSQQRPGGRCGEGAGRRVEGLEGAGPLRDPVPLKLRHRLGRHSGFPACSPVRRDAKIRDGQVGYIASSATIREPEIPVARCVRNGQEPKHPGRSSRHPTKPFPER